MSIRQAAFVQIVVFVLAMTWIISTSILFVITMVMAWLSPGQQLVIDVNSVGEMWLEVALMAILGASALLWALDNLFSAIKERTTY